MLKLLNAKEFAEASVFPLPLVRQYCRSGKIPHWRMGRLYFMEYEPAMKSVMAAQVTEETVRPAFQRKWSFPSDTSRKSVAERLKEL